MKRAFASLFPTRSLSRLLFLFLFSRIYLCCVNEFCVLSCEASGRFSYPGVVRARHQKTPGRRVRPFFSGIRAAFYIPSGRGRGRGRYRAVVFQAVASRDTVSSRRRASAQPPFRRCTERDPSSPSPSSSMSRFIHPRSLSVLLLLSNERRRRAPSSSVERETLSRDGARLAACLSGAGEPAPTQTRERTYTHRKHQT